MIVYYAHCMAIYDTPQEERDLVTLAKLGFAKIINPNSTPYSAACAEIRAEAAADPRGFVFRDGKRYGDPSDAIMVHVFKPLVDTCDVVAFRALPDGMIPSGVAKEVWWAVNAGKIVIELPSALNRRALSTVATREYLTEIGQR